MKSVSWFWGWCPHESTRPLFPNLITNPTPPPRQPLGETNSPIISYIGLKWFLVVTRSWRRFWIMNSRMRGWWRILLKREDRNPQVLLRTAVMSLVVVHLANSSSSLLFCPSIRWLRSALALHQSSAPPTTTMTTDEIGNTPWVLYHYHHHHQPQHEHYYSRQQPYAYRLPSRL